MNLLRIVLASIYLSIAPVTYAQLSNYERKVLGEFRHLELVPATIIDALGELPSVDYPQESVVHCKEAMETNALFRAYPAFAGTLSYVCLGAFPTPVIDCLTLSAQLSLAKLYIKNDGVTGTVHESGVRMFGGNKLRKLQYLLADALAHGHDSVFTFGCAGSNHALQTAVCAHMVGLDCVCMLFDQPNSHIVRRNLLLQCAYKSLPVFCRSRKDCIASVISMCYLIKKNTGKLPYIIPTGGSTPRGVIGYVEAAFELKEQIEAGLLSVPDHIYVTCGGAASSGTSAGLLLGLQAAGIKTKLHLILVEPSKKDVCTARLKNLFTKTNDMLISLHSQFPRCSFDACDFELVTDFSGDDYGLFTQEGVDAIAVVKHAEDLTLDGVYTGKCMSALLADARAEKLKNKTVLFWNTFCAEPLTEITDHVDYHELPDAFQIYFETDVQPLDRRDSDARA